MADGEPGLRLYYHEGYYAAFVRDPDGNCMEAVRSYRRKTARMAPSPLSRSPS